MAERETNELVELTLDIGDPDRSLPFYTDVLGMSVCSSSGSPAVGESVWLLGFGKGANLKLRHRSSEPFRDAVYQPTDNDLFWKIGITLADVDRARQRLVENGIDVSEPCQFHDIGYLCHFEDPDGYCIELLQHRFECNFVRSPALEGYPLGGEAMIGQVSLNVSDIDKALAFYQDQLGLRLLSRQVVPDRGFTLHFIADTNDRLPDPDVDAVENREWLWQRSYTLLELRSWDAKRLQPLETSGAALGFRGMEFSETGGHLIPSAS